jgi:hypothetical protein
MEASANTYINKSHTQDISFYGWSYVSALSFPASASITESNDGAAVHSASFSGMNADYSENSSYGSYTYTSSSLYRLDLTSGYYLSLSSYSVSDPEQGYNTKFTQVSYWRHAGDVTYQSASIYRYYYAYEGNVSYDYAYSYNYDYSLKEGVFTPFGTQYGLNVSLSGADGVVMSAAPNMALVPTNNAFSDDFCWNYSYETATGRNCYQSSLKYQIKQGSAFEYND